MIGAEQYEIARLNVYVSAFALAVAFAALLISVVQVWWQREHQRNSVMPRLTKRGVYRRDADEVGLFIKNVGLGPAIVKSFSVKIDGVQFNQDVSMEVKAAFERASFSSSNIFHSRIGKNTVIQAGESVPIVTTRRSKNKSGVGSFRTFLGNVTYEIEYESLFKDKLQLSVTDNYSARTSRRALS